MKIVKRTTPIKKANVALETGQLFSTYNLNLFYFPYNS